MKKDIQRLGLAIIVGSLAIITGCEQKKSTDSQMNKSKQMRSYDQSGQGQQNGNGSDSDDQNGSCGSGGCNTGCKSGC